MQISTTEAADNLHITESRVRQLLRDGKLVGEKKAVLGKLGDVWVVEHFSVLDYLKNRMPAGRPRKQ